MALVALSCRPFLDSLGECCYHSSPRCARRDHGQTDRSIARHAGHADPQSRLSGPAAWLRGFASHTAGLRRAVGDPAGFAVPSSLPAGTSGLNRQRVGRIRQQAQSEVLPPDRGWPPSTPLRDCEVEPHGIAYRQHSPYDTGESVRLFARLRSWLKWIVKRARLETAMEAELRFHIESIAEDLVRSGVPQQEAMRRARIQFGGIESHKDAI